eukprot:TRINITY_DN23939_c0_g1_i1.p1 TRINITY_DN23939_c0_g1~~TRINITY_DN23939_c0_g1_i1.p1  ORF type:complete len:643 (+),score=82.10 TRINITY_DN23939_c0_g1_i1:68-1930(+)
MAPRRSGQRSTSGSIPDSVYHASPTQLHRHSPQDPAAAIQVFQPVSKQRSLSGLLRSQDYAHRCAPAGHTWSSATVAALDLPADPSASHTSSPPLEIALRVVFAADQRKSGLSIDASAGALLNSQRAIPSRCDDMESRPSPPSQVPAASLEPSMAQVQHEGLGEPSISHSLRRALPVQDSPVLDPPSSQMSVSGRALANHLVASVAAASTLPRQSAHHGVSTYVGDWAASTSARMAMNLSAGRAPMATLFQPQALLNSDALHSSSPRQAQAQQKHLQSLPRRTLEQTPLQEPSSSSSSVLTSPLLSPSSSRCRRTGSVEFNTPGLQDVPERHGSACVDAVHQENVSLGASTTRVLSDTVHGSLDHLQPQLRPLNQIGVSAADGNTPSSGMTGPSAVKGGSGPATCSRLRSTTRRSSNPALLSGTASGTSGTGVADGVSAASSAAVPGAPATTPPSAPPPPAPPAPPAAAQAAATSRPAGPAFRRSKSVPAAAAEKRAACAATTAAAATSDKRAGSANSTAAAAAPSAVDDASPGPVVAAPSANAPVPKAGRAGRSGRSSMPRSTAATAAGAGAVAAKKRQKGASKKLVLPFAYADDDPRIFHVESCVGQSSPEFLPSTLL